MEPGVSLGVSWRFVWGFMGRFIHWGFHGAFHSLGVSWRFVWRFMGAFRLAFSWGRFMWRFMGFLLAFHGVSFGVWRFMGFQLQGWSVSDIRTDVRCLSSLSVQTTTRTDTNTFNRHSLTSGSISMRMRM
jgi:hypothetical protein